MKGEHFVGGGKNNQYKTTLRTYQKSLVLYLLFRHWRISRS